MPTRTRLHFGLLRRLNAFLVTNLGHVTTRSGTFYLRSKFLSYRGRARRRASG